MYMCNITINTEVVLQASHNGHLRFENGTLETTDI
jgi:hypothetical protein